jgi:hypothetical protein
MPLIRTMIKERSDGTAYRDGVHIGDLGELGEVMPTPGEVVEFRWILVSWHFQRDPEIKHRMTFLEFLFRFFRSDPPRGPAIWRLHEELVPVTHDFSVS